jgi:hypothetical protein
MQKSMNEYRSKHPNFEKNVHQLADFYIFALPLAFMVLFTYDAITTGGRWVINMINHGEYVIEIVMNIVWFILIVVKGPRIFSLTIEDEERNFKPFEEKKPVRTYPFVIVEDKKDA